jgi:uncharacterized protein (DUF488 family)
MLTIGHSTLAIETFLGALQKNGCTTLVDVRRFPGSRRHPQFGQESLFTSLAEVGIRGIWREALGGRRPAKKDSINLGWKNSSFRGYADYMQTPAFDREIDWLMSLPALATTAVMCAEAVPWRCHRSLISDAVIARGGHVEDIFVSANGSLSKKPHELTPFARVNDGKVWYPRSSSDPQLFE